MLQRCGLVVAVPLTRDHFLADAADMRKDFVRQFAASFAGYPAERLWLDYAPFATYALQVVGEARAMGVDTATDATFAAWTVATGRHDVITLVAHWIEGPLPAIEYADGPRRVDDVVETLPRDFAGLIDLTVCHSTRAIGAIKKARPRCSVLGNREPARLDVRLAMYRQIIRLVDREGTCYVDAAKRVHLAALEHT
jgi:hypothetical protein